MSHAVRHRVRRAVFVVLCVVLLLLGAGYAGLHSRWGHEQVAERIARAISSRVEGTVDIHGVSGWLPFRVHVERIVAADASGTAWLEVESAACRIRPTGLLRRVLEVDALSAASVWVRLPPRKGSPGVQRSAPALPRFVLDRLAMEQLEIRSPDGDSILDGSLRARLDYRSAGDGIHGTLAIAVSNATARFEAGRVSGSGPWSATLSVQAEPESPIARRLGLPETLSGSGRATFRGESGQLLLDAPDWGRIRSPFRLDGSGTDLRIAFEPEVVPAPGRIPPSIESLIGPVITGACTVAKSGSEGWWVEDIRLGTGPHRATLEIDRPRAGRAAQIAFDGHLGPVDIGAFRAGGAACRGRLTGGEPLRLELQGTVTEPDGLPPDVLSWLGRSPGVQASLQVANGTWTLDDSRIIGPHGSLVTTGTVQSNPVGFSLGWTLTSAGHESLPVFVRLPHASPEGTVRLSGTVVQPLNARELQVTADASPLTFPKASIEEAVLDARWDPGAWHETLSGTLSVRRIRAGNASIEHLEVSGADGSITLPTTLIRLGTARVVVDGSASRDTIALDAELESMPLHQLPLLDAAEGHLEARARLTGSWNDPVLDASAVLNDVRPPPGPGLPTDPFQGSAQLTVSNGLLSTSAQLDGSSPNRIEFSTRLPVRFRLVPWEAALAAGNPGSIGVRGHLDLALLAALPILDEQRLRGVVEFDVTAHGTPDDPTFTGSGTIREARYEHQVLGTDLRELDLRLEAAGDRFNVVTLHAIDPLQGTLRGGGWIRLRPRDAFPFRLELGLDQLRLVANDLVTLTANGPLVLEGSGQRVSVSGDLVCTPLDIRIPSVLPVPRPAYRLVDPGAPAPVANASARPTRGNGIHLDIRLRAPSRLGIRGRGLESEWSGDMRIRGAAPKPRITGRMDSRRGRLDFFGKRFQLREGTIRFAGDWPPRPTLDLRFERSLDERVAALEITGAATEPAVSLTSTPPLPSDELLPLVLFGKSLATVSPFQAVRVAQAARTLAGAESAFDFVGRIQRWLAVDQLDIAPPDDPEAATRITAGKYLHERVYLEGWGDTGTSTGRLSLEVDLTPQISVETDVGSEMNRGIGLQLKRHF